MEGRGMRYARGKHEKSLNTVQTTLPFSPSPRISEPSVYAAIKSISLWKQSVAATIHAVEQSGGATVRLAGVVTASAGNFDGRIDCRQCDVVHATLRRSGVSCAHHPGTVSNSIPMKPDKGEHQPRSGYDRRESDVGQLGRLPDRRRQPERRLPELVEISLDEFQFQLRLAEFYRRASRRRSGSTSC